MTHGAALCEVVHDPVQHFAMYARLRTALGSTLDGHADMDLAGAHEVDDDVVAVEHAKDAGEEAMRDACAIRVDVEDDDVVLDGHCGGETDGAAWPAKRIGGVGEVKERWVGVDDGAGARGVLDVLDADWDVFANDLIHGEGVDDLAAIVGELGGLGGRDEGDEPGGGHFAGVCGEYPVDFFPDLELSGAKAGGEEGRKKIGVASADLTKKRARDSAEEAWRSRGMKQKRKKGGGGRTGEDRNAGGTKADTVGGGVCDGVEESLVEAAALADDVVDEGQDVFE